MKTVAELELTYLPMEEPDFAENPWPYLAAARKQHPWLATCAHGLVLHQYDAIRDVMWLDDKLNPALGDVVEIMEAHGTPWGTWEEEMIINKTGDEHARLRTIVAPAFTPREANNHRPLMRKTIADLLDEWVPRGEFDFEEFASLFPIAVMCGLIGASPDMIPRLKDSMEALGLSMSMDKAHVPALQVATVTFADYCEKLVAERRADPNAADKHDLLKLMLAAQQQGGLTDDELINMLMLLFVAGYDTSKNALTLAMDVMIERPDIYRRCAEDVDYCRKVMEENFRYVTTATLSRRTSAEIEYKDVIIPEGTMLFFPVSIAGRDPSIEDADVFNPDREQKKPHMAFGRGEHICLGQHIARAQIQEGLHQIAQRMQNPRRTGPSGWRPFFGTWGMRGLPIAFDPAPAVGVLKAGEPLAAE